MSNTSTAAATTENTPPLTITVTLNTDGTATLLTSRGSLAHMHHFVYQGITEIASAIEEGVNNLLIVENEPPIAPVPTNAPPVPNRTTQTRKPRSATPSRPNSPLAPTDTQPKLI